MVGGVACIDNAPDTTTMAMCRTFHCRHMENDTEGSVQSLDYVQLHR
jgi:hypothetical protein